MEEQLKIIVDESGRTHVWMNGIEQKYVTKIKFEVSTEDIPTIEIKKAFYVGAI